jgi:hypothetical protein
MSAINDLTIEHAWRGHNNIQDVIRFIDTKNAFLVGLSTTFGGVALAIVAKILCPSDGRFPPSVMVPSYGHLFAIYSILASLAFCAACLVSAALSVKATAPHDDRSVPHSVLFPFHERKKAWDARQYYHKLLQEGMSDALVKCEFADQLAILGAILHAKHEHHRRSVSLIAWQSSMLLFGTVIGLATTSW